MAKERDYAVVSLSLLQNLTVHPTPSRFSLGMEDWMESYLQSLERNLSDARKRLAVPFTNEFSSLRKSHPGPSSQLVLGMQSLLSAARRAHLFLWKGSFKSNVTFLGLVVKKLKDSLGQIEPCHSLKVGPASGHAPVSQSIKFSCQALRHRANTKHVVHDHDHHHHHHHHEKFNRTRL